MTTLLQVETLALGPVETNAYVVADSASMQCVVIDAAWDAPVLEGRIAARGWTLTAIWQTHAHFDHIGAVAGLMQTNPTLPLALHAMDSGLYDSKGGATMWGVPMEAGPKPTVWLAAGQELALGSLRFTVLFVPGHTPGHVAFFEPAAGVLFGGDVLFRGGVGRTDIPGASHDVLMHSIGTQFMVLPDATVVYPGHGRSTTIGAERKSNPFLR